MDAEISNTTHQNPYLNTLYFTIILPLWDRSLNYYIFSNRHRHINSFIVAYSPIFLKILICIPVVLIQSKHCNNYNTLHSWKNQNYTYLLINQHINSTLPYRFGE